MSEREERMVANAKAKLKDYPKVEASVEVRVVGDVVGDEQEGLVLWGADKDALVLMDHRAGGVPDPRPVPWSAVERVEITLAEES